MMSYCICVEDMAGELFSLLDHTDCLHAWCMFTWDELVQWLKKHLRAFGIVFDNQLSAMMLEPFLVTTKLGDKGEVNQVKLHRKATSGTCEYNKGYSLFNSASPVLWWTTRQFNVEERWKRHHVKKKTLYGWGGGFSKNGSTVITSDIRGHIKWSASSANRWIRCSSSLMLNSILRPITNLMMSSWVFLCGPKSYAGSLNWHSVNKTLRSPALQPPNDFRTTRALTDTLPLRVSGSAFSHFNPCETQFEVYTLRARTFFQQNHNILAAPRHLKGLV